MKGRPPLERCRRGHDYVVKATGRKDCVDCQALRNSKEWKANRRHSMWPQGTPVRVMDVLETDGGWLTTPGLALYLGVTTDTAFSALKRLRFSGYVQSRIVELAYSPSGRKQESRMEWRLTTSGREAMAL